MALTRSAVITKITGFTTLKVEGRAKSVLMDTVKQSRTYDNMTRSEVVQRIAEANGYSSATMRIQATDARFAHITQPKISDAQMLRKLARQQGFEFFVDQTGLHWHERDLLQKTARTFVYYTDRGRGDVLNIAVESDVTRRPAAVAKVAHDPATGITTTAIASDGKDTSRAGLAEVVLIKSDDLLNGRTTFSGPQSVGAAYAPTSEGQATKPEAAATEAKAAFRRAQRGSVKLTLEAVGDPTMLAKTVCHLSGVGAALTGRYYVKEVTHNVAAGNYRIQCKMVSDGIGPRSKQSRTVNEEGLPETTPVSSKAKKPPADAPTQDTRGPSNDPNNPSGLSPKPIYGADGVTQIGIGWEESSVTLDSLR
jgi:phage protein D